MDLKFFSLQLVLSLMSWTACNHPPPKTVWTLEAAAMLSVPSTRGRIHISSMDTIHTDHEPHVLLH